MRFFKSFWYIFKIWCVFYTYAPFEFGPATFQVLYSHVWFLANIGLCSYWPMRHWPQHSLETDCTLAKPEAKAYVLLLYQRYNPMRRQEARRERGREGRPQSWPLLGIKNNYSMSHNHLLRHVSLGVSAGEGRIYQLASISLWPKFTSQDTHSPTLSGCM